jgi:hypothetical protein
MAAALGGIDAHTRGVQDSQRTLVNLGSLVV